MINPLNELSEVYKKKIDIKLPQGTSSMGGDGAKPGKNKKACIESMSIEEVEPVNEIHTQAHTPHEVPSKNLKGLVKKAVKRIDADIDGDVDTNDPKSTEMGEFIPSPDGKKKVKTKAQFESYSNWREDLNEYVDVADRTDSVPTKPMDSTDSRKEVKERKIKNKVRINPPQGVTEGFSELGGVIVEMYDITEKIDMKKSSMGDVIKDFRKSNAPQFKGKSDKKKQQMAIAAKLDTEDSMSEETEEEKKKRELLAKTKEHDDKNSGKLAEDEEMSIKDQMRISREIAKNRNPKPDHKAIRGKMLKRSLPKDNRTDAQKMTDATGPRPGSNYRGD